MIYGVNERIIEMVLRRLEKQGSYDILMNGFSLQTNTTPRKASKDIESALQENISCSVGGFGLVFEPFERSLEPCIYRKSSWRSNRG